MPVGTKDEVPTTRWFLRAYGFKEESYKVNRENFQLQSDGVTLLNKVTGQEYHVGPFETPSVLELRDRVKAVADKPAPDPDNGLSFRNIVASTNALYRNPDNAGSVFQVASLYDCMHNTLQKGCEEGLSLYADKATQGIASAIACPGATAYRNFVLNEPGKPKVDCLNSVGEVLRNEKEGYWTMKNGYCIPKPPAKIAALSARLEKDKVLAYDVEELLRVGIHWDTEVEEVHHKVCQVLCGCVPVGFTKQVKAEDWQKFAQLLLDGAYDATLTTASLLAAQRKDRVRVFLTALGGGAMSNRTKWIGQAIDKALTRHANAPLDVILVHFGTCSNPVYQQLEDDRPPPQPKAVKSITSQIRLILQQFDDEDADEGEKKEAEISEAVAIQKAFEYFDSNGDGVIDRHEFYCVLSLLDKDLFTMQTIDLLLDQADANGDGEVHYAEFVAWLCGQSSMVCGRIIGSSQLKPEP